MSYQESTILLSNVEVMDNAKKENEYLRLLNSFYDRGEDVYNEFIDAMNSRKLAP
jgi:hypothetical protein